MDPDPPNADGAPWRDEVALYLRGLFVLALLVMATTALGQVWSGNGSWSLTFMVAVQVLATAGLVVLRRSPHAAAMVAIVALFAVQATTLLHFGPVQGAGMLVALSTVVGVIYFGVRVGVALLVLSLVETVGIGLWLTHSGALPVLDIGLASTWIRSATITTFMGGFVLATMGFVVSAVERALAKAKAAEQAEAAARRDQERVGAALARARELEAMGRLAGGVAHDFNNSLTVLLAYSEDLLERDLPADVRDRVRGIDQAGRAAAATTQQLLVFARGGADRRGACDPGESLKGGLKNLRRLLPEDVVLDLAASNTSWVPVSASDLLQVVLNLVLNARDALPHGGRIGVRVTEMGSRVAIAVEDTGVGMDEATKSRLFEPFFTTKGDRGTGLGMAMVQRTVAEAGGEMQVESTPGAGTRIVLALPAVPRLASAPTPIEALGSLAGAKILVVEDDLEIQGVVRDSLVAAGAQVDAVGSVREALGVLASGRVADMLCTDGVLTDGTALPVIERFQQRFPKAPILLCSGHIPEELETRGLLRSRHERLPKPFTGNELVRAVGRLLDRAGPEV